jgi:site-specific recombinase XerD
MDKSFGLLFYPKKNRHDRVGESIIYMRITVDNERCDISTKRKCTFAKWNKISGRMNVKEPSAKEFNSYLDTLQQKVFEAKRRLLEVDKLVTPESIKDLLLGKSIGREKKMVLAVFQQHNDQMKTLVGTEFAPGTLQRYEVSFRHTKSFIESRYKKSDLAITHLNFEFLTEYEFWLKSVRKCDHNTAMKYLSNFKKIVNRCLRNGWLEKDPFFGFKMAKREVERTALTENELQTMMDKTFSIERLAIVRDIFLFSCYSGLAYADVKKLKNSEIIIGHDNEKWLISKRQKTDISARIPLLPAALTLIDRYKDHPQCLLTDRVLPVLSNQKMNAYLKEIADVCGISKALTFHIARHTFATTVTLSNGVPIETVSKMLGHRNLKTTQHYAKILDLKVSKDMKHLRDKYI